MAILIQNTDFTTSGVALGTSNVYVDVMIVFPHGTGNAQARLLPYPYTNGAKGESPFAQLDGIHDFSFSPTVLVENDFWTDVNAGRTHDYIISQLEAEQPRWQGKISKTIPQE